MSMYKFIEQAVKMKFIKPKVYSILLTNSDSGSRILWQVADYCLEDALKQAKKEIIDKHNLKNIDEYKIDLFVDDDVNSLFKRFTSKKEQAETKTSDKISSLMKQIIDNGDKELFKENKDLFSATQLQYIKDRLKDKK